MPTWNPFRNDPLDGPWVDAYAERDPERVRRACEALQATLADTELLALDLTQHPLGIIYATRAGRWHLLEAGWMLALLEPEARVEYGHRIVSPSECSGAIAELQSGFLLTLLGGEDLTRDPLRGIVDVRGNQVRGPDWRVAFRGNHFGVETKQPRESGAARQNRRLLVHSYFTLATLAPELASGKDIALLPDALAGAFHETHVESRVLEALCQDDSDPAKSLVAAGFANVRETTPGCGTMIHGLDVDESNEQKRLYDDVEDAGSQLARLEHPGIVIVDAGIDSSLPSRCCAVVDALHRRDGLAVALIVQHRAPGFVVKIVLGPSWRALPAGFWEALRPGGCGHVHIPTFGPSSACDDPGFLPPAICNTSVSRFGISA